MTPSDEVDQAWHLHLTYTRHYWGPFTEALGAPLHHGPTEGGQTEDKRYKDNYADTLASYKEAFGEAAPADIWPPAKVRFGDAAKMRRINLGQHYVMAKSHLHMAGFLTGGGLFTATAAAAADGGLPPAIEQVLTRVHEWGVPLWFAAMFVFFFAFIILNIIFGLGGRALGVHKSKKSGGCSGGRRWLWRRI